MTIGISIVHFVIKVPKLVQMIDIEYMLNKYPFSIQDGRHEIQFFDIFTSDGGVPAHHRDRPVRTLIINHFKYPFHEQGTRRNESH